MLRLMIADCVLVTTSKPWCNTLSGKACIFPMKYAGLTWTRYGVRVIQHTRVWGEGDIILQGMG